MGWRKEGASDQRPPSMLEEEDLEQARGATKDLLHIFVIAIYLFSLSVWKLKVVL